MVPSFFSQCATCMLHCAISMLSWHGKMAFHSLFSNFSSFKTQTFHPLCFKIARPFSLKGLNVQFSVILWSQLNANLSDMWVSTNHGTVTLCIEKRRKPYIIRSCLVCRYLITYVKSLKVLKFIDGPIGLINIFS